MRKLFLYSAASLFFFVSCRNNKSCCENENTRTKRSQNIALEDIQTDPEMVKDLSGMVLIKGGSFDMGGDNMEARIDELPKHKMVVKDFWMDESEVTNFQFKKFVDATEYVTSAEIDFDYKDQNGNTINQKAGSLVFVLVDPSKIKNPTPNDWWKFTEGTNWRHPQGPGSSIEGKDNVPVVHVSWNDAQAYCKWSGKHLPTEAEWEYAARGKLKNKIYPWGNELRKRKGNANANIWDGPFPFYNSGGDPFDGIAPVKFFPANSVGLYDMAGNVWEWCVDDYHSDYYSFCKNHKFENGNVFLAPEEIETDYILEKVMRGGSFMCNDSYCSGYRVSARMKSSPETSLEHTGFRCVRDVKNN